MHGFTTVERWAPCRMTEGQVYNSWIRRVKEGLCHEDEGGISDIKGHFDLEYQIFALQDCGNSRRKKTDYPTTTYKQRQERRKTVKEMKLIVSHSRPSIQLPPFAKLAAIAASTLSASWNTDCMICCSSGVRIFVKFSYNCGCPCCRPGAQSVTSNSKRGVERTYQATHS